MVPQTNSTPKSSIQDIHLTSKELHICREELQHILIAPFDKEKCKGVGYNISPSELCYSVRKKRPLPVHRTPQETYVWIPPHDTILTLSHEYLQVSSHVEGCFLSRLRPVAKGLGNVSTTLDPCWKGMLLLPISNPSSRKVKLVISQLKDDQLTPSAVITMMLWKIAPRENEKQGSFTFRLDNPAMRTDIWTELIDEPRCIFHRNQYKRFKDLIYSLINYHPSENFRPWILELQKELDNLEKAIYADPLDPNRIQELLLNIHHLESETMPEEVFQKLYNLYGVNPCHIDSLSYSSDAVRESVIAIKKSLSEDSHKKTIKKTIKDLSKHIDLLYRECDYQKLCDQVSDIHQIIQKNTEYRRKGDFWKRIWFNLILPNLGAGIATIFLFFILFAGQTNIPSNMQKIINAIACLVPTLFSFILNHYAKK